VPHEVLQPSEIVSAIAEGVCFEREPTATSYQLPATSYQLPAMYNQEVFASRQSLGKIPY
jgi:hypothetical protein